MARAQLSVTIITLNEERNLPRAIKSVGWADEVLVVDSGSVDRTCEIARQMGAKVFQNTWEGYGQQKNFAQKRATHDWVLNIDADEEVSPELAAEIQQVLENPGETKAYCFPRKTFYLGRWIRHGGWYPNYQRRLAERKFATWSEPPVHESLEVRGPVEKLRAPMHHYTFSGIQDQILTNLRFSRLGYMELKKKGKRPSLFHLVFKPIGKFIETYFLKLGLLDGMAGFIISVNAAHSMFLKHAYLYEPSPEPADERLSDR